MTALRTPALVRAAGGALLVALVAPAAAEVRPAASNAGESATRVLLFRILMREYLEFRVGSQVTIRSNAGQVVVTATDPRGRSEALARDGERAGRSVAVTTPAKPLPGAAMPPAAVVADVAGKGSGTNVCLYLQGSEPSCGDLSEVAGRVIYTASNP